MPFEPFSLVLMKRGLQLTRAETNTLQINVGLLCNQTCRHCHLGAGPDCREVMNANTAKKVVDFAQRGRFQVVDITGGAPEMNPHLGDLILGLSAFAPRIMLRSNLTAVSDEKLRHILDLCREYRVVIVASLPSLDMTQTEAQRGRGVWEKSIATLQQLNSMGYGQSGSGMEINLVSNPTGAFLPPSQVQVEKKFRQDLQRKWGIVFNNLYTFANSPLGRFRQWLVKSGNFEQYMQKLTSNFNPCTVDGLMCRSLLSVSWEGYLYDCDFNLASGLFMGGRKVHVSEMDTAPAPGTPIIVSDHCYACTSGSGFT